MQPHTTWLPDSVVRDDWGHDRPRSCPRARWDPGGGQAIQALRGDAIPGPELISELLEDHRRATNSPCSLTVMGEPGPLASEANVALYRTAQEALSNVRKHAPSAGVDVKLIWEGDGARLIVESRDGASSTDPESGSGYGLAGMSERAQLAGGSLVTGPTADGFRVELQAPAEGGDR
jgi:signal transduction histidine kinase